MPKKSNIRKAEARRLASATRKRARKDVQTAERTLQKMGYSSEAAKKYSEKLIEQGHGSGLPGFEERVRTAGTQRIQEFREQAGRGVSATGREYIAWAEEARKYVPDLWDYAEAAAEGRYKDALRYNAELFNKKQQEAEELAEQFRAEAARLTGDAAAESRELAEYWSKRADTLAELASQYATGQPRNIKYTAGYKALQSVFK